MSEEVHLAPLAFAAIFLLWQEMKAPGQCQPQEMGTVTAAPFLPPKIAPWLAIYAARFMRLICIISLMLLKFNVLLRLPGSDALIRLPS